MNSIYKTIFVVIVGLHCGNALPKSKTVSNHPQLSKNKAKMDSKPEPDSKEYYRSIIYEALQQVLTETKDGTVKNLNNNGNGKLYQDTKTENFVLRCENDINKLSYPYTI